MFEEPEPEPAVFEEPWPVPVVSDEPEPVGTVAEAFVSAVFEEPELVVVVWVDIDDGVVVVCLTTLLTVLTVVVLVVVALGLVMVVA